MGINRFPYHQDTRLAAIAFVRAYANDDADAAAAVAKGFSGEFGSLMESVILVAVALAEQVVKLGKFESVDDLLGGPLLDVAKREGFIS